MKPADFRLAVADLEKGTEGGALRLDLLVTVGGRRGRMAGYAVERLRETDSVVRLRRVGSNRPDDVTYLDVAAIAAIRETR
ncbi:hypothetical protein [Croceicoccus naphthovorans]|uniref:hypothetical protein n=1 Tax=Croceicoccus naphthovorans TaxID=1348774 RepID=UPI000AE26A82|nr:hypothetical protein [Croceicoccus naphthovorans]MBB3990284.1 hypothetical protein [Croceicoccus naphthovorans]